MLGLQNCKDRNLLKVFRKWMTKKQLSKKIPTKFFEFLEGWKNFFCELRTFGEQWKKLNFLLLLLVASNFMLTLEIAQYFCCRSSLYFSLNHLFSTCTTFQFYDWKVHILSVPIDNKKTTAVNVHSSLGLFFVKLNFRNRITLFFVIPKKERKIFVFVHS